MFPSLFEMKFKLHSCQFLYNNYNNYDIKQQSWWLYTTVAILAVINSEVN